MNIPPFPLPSCFTEVVHFRVPTVDDAMLFSELDESQEETVTTQFLNHIQNLDKQKEVNDSALWTGEDRRTALWWIFIATQDDPTLTVSYPCGHCGESHHVDVRLPDLAERSTVLQKKPQQEIECDIKGQHIKGVIVRPLNGQSCEAIELLRNIRDSFEFGSLDYRKANREMMLHELAHVVTFPSEPNADDQDEVIAHRLELIKSMAVDTEFRSMCASVEMALRSMRHGLLTQYHEGSYMLVADREPCPNQEGDDSNLLLLPFRNNDFIPNL